MSWTIRGQAGRTLNQTARTPASILIENITVKFASLDHDTLTWTSATENVTAGGTIVPDIGQIVELYWNDTRRFRGHVTETRVGLNRVKVVAHGPWWWLKQTPLTSLQLDGTGTSSERAQFVFEVTGAQTLATMIARLLDRAIALGCPLARGGMSAMYPVPRITLSGRDCASALAELMRWVPDAVAWFDYSTTLPTLKIQRRGPSTPLVLSLATSNIKHVDIRPRLDLQVSRAEVKFVTRDATTGKPKWAGQAAGTNAAGQRQIITVSGPEIAAFLPKDDFDTHQIRTLGAANYANLTEPSLAAAKEKYSSVPVTVGTGYEVTYWNKVVPVAATGPPWQISIPGGSKTTYIPAPLLRGTNGAAFVGPRFCVISGTLPEWVRKLPNVRAEEGVIYGVLVYQKLAAAAIPAFVGEMGLTETMTGYRATGTGPGGAEFWHLYTKPFTMPVTVVRTNFPAMTTLYKPWDFTYLTPPANLAVNLRAAQNWVPWEGPITTVADDVTSASNLLGRSINLTGGLPACATMKALLKSVTYEIQHGRTTYDLGAPARTDFGGLVSRVRRDPQDNIEYL
jgi:hypothetical protein